MGSGEREIEVTQNSAVKKAVRARMAETGEKYTEARRNLLGSTATPSPPAAGLPEGYTFQPESLTAAVCGGGMSNLGLVMPTLLRLAEEGHPVHVAAHEGEPSAWNMASPFDFLVASGAIGAEELANLWTSGVEEDQNHLRKLMKDLPISFANGPRSSESWIEALESSQENKHAVLYVPDLQVDYPLSDWPSRASRSSLSDFDIMPAQLTGLRSVAREANAAVVGGHCMPIRMEGGWRVVEEIVDEFMLLSTSPRESADEVQEAQIEVHSRWAEERPARVEQIQIDTRFSQWRLVVMAKQKEK